MELDAPTIERVRQKHSVDLASIEESTNPWTKFDADLCLLVNVLWTICQEQAGDVTEAQFGRSLVGQAIEDAVEALESAVADFFPPRRRRLLLCLRDRNQQLTNAVEQMAIRKAEDKELDRQIMEAAERAMDDTIKDRLTRLSSHIATPE